MPEPDNKVIGYIIDVQGNMLTATLVEDDQGRAPTVTIGDEDILVGQLGSYVAIRQNDVNIVAIVTRMTEQEVLAAPTIETPGEDTARLSFAKRIARLTPIGSLRDDGQFDRGVGRYPTTGAEVHAIGSADIAKMFERFQSKGFSVGTVATHPSLKVCLDPSNLLGATSQFLDKLDRASLGRSLRWCNARSLSCLAPTSLYWICMVSIVGRGEPQSTMPSRTQSFGTLTLANLRSHIG